MKRFSHSDFLTTSFLSVIENHVQDPSRTFEVSTIGVDHQLPRMSGLELLQTIEIPHAKKILLPHMAE